MKWSSLPGSSDVFAKMIPPAAVWPLHRGNGKVGNTISAKQIALPSNRASTCLACDGACSRQYHAGSVLF